MHDVTVVDSSDTITLTGIRAHGFHGVLAEERTLGQVFVADLTLFLDLTAAGSEDALEQTVNYADVAVVVEEVLTGRPYALIEAVALQIINRLLSRFSHLKAVQVTLHKPQAPLSTAFTDVAVTMLRTRKQRERTSREASFQHHCPPPVESHFERLHGE